MYLVSADAPHFNTMLVSGDMQVVGKWFRVNSSAWCAPLKARKLLAKDNHHVSISIKTRKLSEHVSHLSYEHLFWISKDRKILNVLCAMLSEDREGGEGGQLLTQLMDHASACWPSSAAAHRIWGIRIAIRSSSPENKWRLWRLLQTKFPLRKQTIDQKLSEKPRAADSECLAGYSSQALAARWQAPCSASSY